MRLLKIEVLDAEARNIAGEKNGRQYSFHVQEVMCWFEGQKYPRPCEVTIPKDRNGQPFSQGEYIPVPDFYIDRRNNLSAGFTIQPKPATARTGTTG